MHSIQLFILLQLADSDSLRYSDMRPPSMEASQFMYHLKALAKNGLVDKRDARYQLTAKGKLYVDRFDHQSMRPHDYPRVTIALLYEHENNGWLLVKRTQQPAIGRVGFLLVDVPIDYPVPLATFAAQSFEEATGIHASFVHRADGYIRVNKGEYLEGNMLTHIFCAHGKDMPKRENSSFTWSSVAPETDLFSSTTFVINKLSTRDTFFFFEYTARI